MKTKLEKKLDEEFEQLGIKPQIHHFQYDSWVFNAITTATVSGLDEVDDFEESFFELVQNIRRSKRKQFGHPRLYHEGSYVLQKLTALSYGAAICDSQDQFNRQRGRVIAKGRLLKICKSWKVFTSK